ncbi:hypothetical protein [Clostridium sp.]|uniref:hypothetical protein n=1 Tax=Clostridium sp. TaxID=1506 RepID=UPI002907FBD6|nr:hypothetical protein [Clostridium sp.]MDU4479722.1 hypothetical protein [Clostridium sp.]
MKKYLCISCKQNYYGFCKIKKVNGLKQNNIRICEFYEINKCFVKYIKIRRV